MVTPYGYQGDGLATHHPQDLSLQDLAPCVPAVLDQVELRHHLKWARAHPPRTEADNNNNKVMTPFGSPFGHSELLKPFALHSTLLSPLSPMHHAGRQRSDPYLFAWMAPQRCGIVRPPVDLGHLIALDVEALGPSYPTGEGHQKIGRKPHDRSFGI